MRRVVTVAVALVAAIALLPACGKQERIDRELRAILDRNEGLANRYVYSDISGGDTTVVRGIVEDDFRYKAQVSVNRTPVVEEVGRDDVLADRFQDPSRLTQFADKAVATAADETQLKTIRSLQAGQWVLDPAGAPSLVASAKEKRPQGEDPVFDSLTTLRFVENVILDSKRVRRFNKEAIDYKAKEDPFPTPAKGSGIIRYDLERRDLPSKANATGAGSNQTLPNSSMFRKLSVYVKKGHVIEIREVIDVDSRLSDMARLYDVKIPKGVSRADFRDTSVEIINTLRKAQGLEPMRVRTMRVQFFDIGKRLKVELPSAGATGDLSVLRHRGRLALSRADTPSDAGAGGATAGSGESTTSTSASESPPTTASP